MNKKYLLLAFFLVTIFLLIFFLPSGEQKTTRSSDQSLSSKTYTQVILFYGEGCPHCATVKDFIKEQNIENKITLSEKEIYYSNENAIEFEEKARSCGLPQESMGVPMLWAENECFLGSPDITEFFNNNVL